MHSTSVVDCGSAYNLPDYVKLCTHLGIDFYVIHDEDYPGKDEGQQKRNERIAKAVSAASPMHPSLHRYVPDLETALGKAKHCGLDALLAALDGKSYEEITVQYPDLVKPVEEIVATRFPTSKGSTALSPSKD